jgi:hypothetical protein
MKPAHLATLLEGAERTGADYIYSWYEAVGFGEDPLPHFGKTFNPGRPTQTTITVLVRTELAQQAGFHPVLPGKLIDGERYGEDFQFTLDILALGGTIVHIPQRTWLWNFHGSNTSGLATKGDART